MIEKMQEILLFLSQETNLFLTIFVLISFIAAAVCCFLWLADARYRQILLASMLTASVFFGICSLGLVTKAFQEIGLREYHFLVKTGQKHPVLNRALAIFINHHNNKLNGIDYAVIKNQLTHLEREHVKKIIQKEKRNA